MAESVDRYGPARRIHQLKELLNTSGGATAYEIADRLGVSVPTARRYVHALEEAGEPLYDEVVDGRKVWRLLPSVRQGSITLTTAQMVSLFLSRRVFDFLEGTGFKEDLDEVFDRLGATLRREDFVAAKNLDRKLFDVNEAPHKYSGRIDDMNAIITALLREEQLSVRHGSVWSWRKTFLIDPYTILVYKKGLYLAGHSHHHQAIRTFSLDGFREVNWLRGDRFDYPADYHPRQLVEGNFGLFPGPLTRVRIFFDRKVRRYVSRRKWHPTQKVRRLKDGIELTMEVRGTVELVSWVLSFGEHAEVLEPESLREEIAAELERAARRYRGILSSDDF